MFKRVFHWNKASISRSLRLFLRKQKGLSRSVNAWGNDAIRRLVRFVAQGKMVRGGLVLLAYQATGKRVTDSVVRTAAAIELLHAGLLIHDDIMDRDERRRGAPSVFAQYVQQAQQQGIADSLHYGEAMGTCVGDVVLFWAAALLAQALQKEKNGSPVIHRIFNELGNTALAQMQDVHYGMSKSISTVNEVLRLYTYKTARYTFSLPLMVGAVLAGQNRETIRLYEQLGEHLGIVFQIKDDELGLFGNEQETGKPVGSDIREGKKTLLQVYLMQKASTAEKRKLGDIFGNQKITKTDIDYVRSLVDKYQIVTLLTKDNKKRLDAAARLIQVLPINQKNRILLRELAVYITARDR